MATEDDIRALIGRPAPWDATCEYCGTRLVIVGSWWPPDCGALMVFGCPRCHATYNGGRS
jgi:hypothetical protein